MTRKVGSAALTISVLWAVVSLVLKSGIGVSLAAGPPSQSNFTRDFQIACLDDQHFVGCEFAALLTEPFVANSSDFDQDAINAFPRVLILPENDCNDCETEVSLLESDLATNGTAQELTSTFNQACKKVRTPSAKKNCAAQAAAVPAIIDQVLSNDPPIPACDALNLCP
jgi:hypothetical protein